MEKARQPARLNSSPAWNIARVRLPPYSYHFFFYFHSFSNFFSFSFPFQATEIGSFTRRFPCEINDSECNMPSFLTLLCCHCHNLVTAVNGLFTIQSRVSLLDGEREAVLHKGSLFNNNNTTTTTTAVGRAWPPLDLLSGVSYEQRESLLLFTNSFYSFCFFRHGAVSNWSRSGWNEFFSFNIASCYACRVIEKMERNSIPSPKWNRPTSTL